MKIKFNGRNLTIDDKELERNMKVLKLTKDEAIKQWLEDNDYLVNEEQMALVEKTKGQKMAKTHDGTKKRNVTRKVDEDKLAIIALLNETLIAAGYESVVVENDQKLITFEKDGQHFKLDLIKQRVKK